jgi:signal transduction histidine kinase
VTSTLPEVQPTSAETSSPFGPIGDALDAATRAIAAEPSLDRVLQLIVDRVRPLVAARYAALGIMDDEGGMERFITSGMEPGVIRDIGSYPRGRGLLGVIVRENRSVRVPDVMSDPRRSGFPSNHPRMHSFLGVPVQVEGRSIGNLYLTEKQGAPEFSEEDMRLVETFARHAGIAMHNARMHDQLKRLAVVAERERIGQDLHDGIIQNLYAVGLTLEDVEELMTDDPAEARARVDRAIESIHGTIRDIRNFILGLGPEFLEGSSLAGALAALAEEVRVANLIEVRLDLSSSVELDPDGTTQLLHLAREALSNVARHARATRVTIEFGRQDSALTLRIIDNGRGFDVTRTHSNRHRGLANMRRRAKSLGGSLKVDSGPGGTQVVFRLPLADATGDGPGSEAS